MALSLLNIQSIFSFIAYTIAYMITITFTEVLVANTAEQLGDDTPKLLGYGSTNPLSHFNPIYYIMFLTFGVTFIPEMPVDIDNFKPYKTLKTFVFNLSSSFYNFIMSIIALTFSLILIGYDNTIDIMKILFGRVSIDLDRLSIILKNYSSLKIVLSSILIVTANLSLFFASLNLIVGTLRSFLDLNIIDLRDYKYSMYISLIIALLLLLFLNKLILSILIISLKTITFKIANFIGLL